MLVGRLGVYRVRDRDKNNSVRVATTTQTVYVSVRVATVSFHNFKSQNFKLSVSNPKSKYVACLSVLSRISNCQGLGRKTFFEILKTDRTTPGLHNKIPALKIFARGWVAQESIFLHYQR